MILFFDIDGTLLNTSGAGIKSIHQGAKDAFGDHFSIDGLTFAGCLDPVIVSDMLVMNNIPDTPENHRLIRDGYFRHLQCHLPLPSPTPTPPLTPLPPLPGVHELLQELKAIAADHATTLALLTGNYQETGTHKLQACGIDPSLFAFGVWGDDAPHRHADPTGRAKREDLVPVGMSKAQARGVGLRPDRPHQYIIIGDTPHDVRCAKAHGGKCLAVATGHYSVESLAAAGADLALPDLSDTPQVLRWLLS